MVDERDVITLFKSSDSSSLTQGKYAAKSKDFLTQLTAYQKDKSINQYVIKPIQFTFEITNQCNCHCKDCGMLANRIAPLSLTTAQLDTLIESLNQVGVMSYAITGGEPFLKFENMCYFMERAQGKLDIIKIISNGFWGYKAEEIFKKLSGYLNNNRFVIPSLQISIGEQDVPLKYIASIIHYYVQHISPLLS